MQPGGASFLAVALFLVAIALRFAVGNRHVRSRLTASAVAFAVCVLAGVLVAYSRLEWLSPELREQLTGGPGTPGAFRGTIQPLLLTFGGINLLFALLLNPWRENRLPDRFPKIVQDALVIGCFALAATLMFPERIFAASAVGAVVIGFALQDTLGNLFAGLAIQIEKPFRVGHWVHVAGQDGQVSEITWRATKLRTKAGNFLVVPNSVLSRDTILNYSEPIVETRIEVEVGVSYDAPPNDVKAVILQAIEDEPLISSTRPPEVLLVDFAASAITYRVRVWIADFAADERARDRVRSAVYYAFRRHKVTIPYPIQVEIQEEPRVQARDLESIERALAAAPILAGLSQGERHSLADAGHEQLYAAGEAIVSQGDPGSSMFIVVRGETIVLLEPGNREVARLGPGGLFGEMSLLTGAPRSATVRAAADVRVVEIGIDAFRRFVLANPSTLEQIGLAVARRAAELEEHRTAAHAPAPSEAPQNFLARIRGFLGID